jgi:hypothetical protein
VLSYPDNTICKFKVEEGNAASVVGENFASDFVAGSLAVDATCPLDVPVPSLRPYPSLLWAEMVTTR